MSATGTPDLAVGTWTADLPVGTWTADLPVGKLLRLAVLCAAALLPACACEVDSSTLEHRVQSLEVEILSISSAAPPAQTGDDPAHALPIPLTNVRIEVSVSAYDELGKPATDFDRPISFRITPGDVVDVLDANGTTTGNRMLPVAGGLARGFVVVTRTFSEARIWAQDAPPDPIWSPPDFEDPFGRPMDAGVEPMDAGRSYAAGVSRPIYFMQPTIADVQRTPLPPGCNPTDPVSCRIDNKTSPLVGNFLTVEAPRPRGDMIVTAIFNDGFYVTDLAARRVDAPVYDTTAGTFGHIFIYNYNYPDGLLVGDRINAITGTVQEFSGHTQLTFPSWIRVEGDPRPEDLPEPLLLDFSSPTGIGYRVCDVDPNAQTRDHTDLMCAWYNSNIDVESLESSIVRVVNAVPSNEFVNCDQNGNGGVLFFNISSGALTCYEDPKEPLTECECNGKCVLGLEEHAGKICSELTNMLSYGQWVVKLDQTGIRINVTTRDALPELDPRVFTLPEYEGCTLDITGVLRQVQAARPRWQILARDDRDVCCRAPAGKSCPPAVPTCPTANQ